MNKKEIAALAKKAWDQAIADKKTADEIATLKSDYETKQAAADAEDTKTVSDTELTNLITKAVTAGIDGMKGQFASVPNEEAIAKIVTKTIEGIDRKNVEEMVTKSLNAAVAECKQKSKLNGADGTKSLEIQHGRTQVEYPCSFSGDKNNLPLWGKQLLNVLLHGKKLAESGAIMGGMPIATGPAVLNEGISAEAIADGATLGKKCVDRLLMRCKAWGDAPLTSEEEADRWGMAQKALTGDVGGDLTRIELAQYMQYRFFLETKLATLAGSLEVEQPVLSYPWPMRTTLPQFSVGATQTQAQGTATGIGTAQPTLVAKKLMGEADYSYEAEESAIIPILPEFQKSLSQGAAQAWERALISGDDTGTGADTAGGGHMDYDIVDTAGTYNIRPCEKLWKGLRYYAATATAVNGVNPLTTNCAGAAPGKDFLDAMRGKMKKYGVDPSKLVLVVGPLAHNILQSIPQMETMEKFGPMATIVTGEFTKYRNIPVICSEWMREDLASTGVNTSAGPNTFGSCLLFRPERFLYGRFRNFTLEIFREIWTQQMRVVASFMRSFVPKETPSATVPIVSYGYNMKVS